MSELPKNLIYNKEKAGLNTSNAEEIREKIVDASKDTKYFERIKERSHNVDSAVEEMRFKLTCATKSSRKQALKEADALIEKLKSKRNMNDTYLHADLDMFYAAVEALDDPSLNDIPFAVGGDVKHGVISTSSYKARKFGVRSGMAVFIAMKLCPELKIVPHHGAKYKHYSDIVRSVFRKYDPDFTAFGLDEASLNVTKLTTKGELDENGNLVTGESIAKKIQKEVFDLTKLTLSVGVAHTTQLAKIASDINKPNGIYSVSKDPDEMQAFVDKLPIRKIPGIGGVAEQTLQGLGINFVRDIIEKREDIWLTQRPIFREFLFAAALGVYQKVVNKGPQQSISKECTFDATYDRCTLMDIIERLSAQVHSVLKDQGSACKTVGVRFKDNAFNSYTRNFTFQCETSKKKDITNAALKLLLDDMKSHVVKYRLLGVRVSSLTKPGSKVQQSIRAFAVNSSYIPPKKEASKKDEKTYKKEENKEMTEEEIAAVFNVNDDDSDDYEHSSCYSLQYNYEEDRFEFACEEDVIETPKNEEKETQCVAEAKDEKVQEKEEKKAIDGPLAKFLVPKEQCTSMPKEETKKVAKPSKPAPKKNKKKPKKMLPNISQKSLDQLFEKVK